MSMEALTIAVLDLVHELPRLPDQLMVGGGFGLYLKQRHLEETGEADTLIPGEAWPPARATADVDLLLPTEIIADIDEMRAIRAALDRLGYVPEVEHFQFSKRVGAGLLKIDLLTCTPSDTELSKLYIKKPRVRPRGDVQLHAYLTPEAIALNHEPLGLTLTGVRSDGESASVNLRIPNAFTYLLMKLFAFRDRVNEARKNLAEHHALDLYRIVAMVTEGEYDLVRRLRSAYAEDDVVVVAQQIVRDFYADESALGILRLRSASRATRIDLSRESVRQFRQALLDLFADEA